MAITSAGVGSGLDLEAIIAATIDAENTPKLARFEKQESAVNLQLTALGQIKSDLSTFEDSVDILKDLTNFEKRTATVTQPDDNGDVISVSAESTATAGSFDIDVKQLAQGSRAVQDDEVLILQQLMLFQPLAEILPLVLVPKALVLMLPQGQLLPNYVLLLMMLQITLVFLPILLTRVHLLS